MNIKLGDFGISCPVNSELKAQTSIGTKKYVAPEIVRGEKYSFEVDVFDFGISMFELLSKIIYTEDSFENEPIGCDDNEPYFKKPENYFKDYLNSYKDVSLLFFINQIKAYFLFLIRVIILKN